MEMCAQNIVLPRYYGILFILVCIKSITSYFACIYLSTCRPIKTCSGYKPIVRGRSSNTILATPDFDKQLSAHNSVTLVTFTFFRAAGVFSTDLDKWRERNKLVHPSAYRRSLHRDLLHTHHCNPFVSISAKCGNCTVVRLYRTLVEVKIRTFKGAYLASSSVPFRC